MAYKAHWLLVFKSGGIHKNNGSAIARMKGGLDVIDGHSALRYLAGFLIGLASDAVDKLRGYKNTSY